MDVEAVLYMRADPLMTPRILSLSATASSSRLRITMPTPSPRAYPSASSWKVRHPPSNEIIPERPTPEKSNGAENTEPPPAAAMSQSRERRLLHAKVRAVVLEAQTESKVYAPRPNL